MQKKMQTHLNGTAWVNSHCFCVYKKKSISDWPYCCGVKNFSQVNEIKTNCAQRNNQLLCNAHSLIIPFLVRRTIASTESSIILCMVLLFEKASLPASFSLSFPLRSIVGGEGTIQIDWVPWLDAWTSLNFIFSCSITHLNHDDDDEHYNYCNTEINKYFIFFSTWTWMCLRRSKSVYFYWWTLNLFSWL